MMGCGVLRIPVYSIMFKRTNGFGKKGLERIDFVQTSITSIRAVRSPL